MTELLPMIHTDASTVTQLEDKLAGGRWREEEIQEERWELIAQLRLAGLNWRHIANILSDRITHKFECDPRELRDAFDAWIAQQNEKWRRAAEIAQRNADEHRESARQANAALAQSVRATAVLRTLL
jgi:hypothetical protein